MTVAFKTPTETDTAAALFCKRPWRCGDRQKYR
jgi:hypothetical protein